MTRSIVAAIALLLTGMAGAAPFGDPTQPPALRDAGDASMASGGPRVESILIAPDRRLAVINGEQVTVGSRVGSGAVVRITDTEVVVRGADGEQTLKLFPELARSAAAPAKKGASK